MRLSAVRQIVALVSLAAVAAAPVTTSADEEKVPVPPFNRSLSKLPTLKLATKAAPAAAETVETPQTVEDCETNDTCPVATGETEQPSHRRGAEKKKPSADTEAAGTSMERLQELCADEVVLQPIIVRSTLADAMRRVALWGDCCPICGHSTSGTGHTQAEARHTAEPLPRQQVLDMEDAKPAPKPAAAPLQAGEPAQVILDTQKRLGKSVTDGTEFGGSPELLIQWIRILDEENRRRQLASDDADRQEPSEPIGEDASATAQKQLEALRHASRQLQDAAELLEEQNLFESADSLRGFADVLRHQSRKKLAQIGPLDDVPLSPPRHARAKARLNDAPAN